MKVELKARVKFLASTEGGRGSRFYSGYRPALRFRDEIFTDVSLDFLSVELCEPGSELTVELTFLHPRTVYHEIVKGAKFELFEGTKRIGTGELLE